MKCEEVRDEMIAYLKGELDEERKAEIEAHLARCQGCARELEMSRRVLFLTEAANDASIVRKANSIMAEGIKAGASDIHIDPIRPEAVSETIQAGGVVRFRIDGVLHEVEPGKLYAEPERVGIYLTVEERDALVGRIKVMAGLSLAESKMPQDGRIALKLDDRGYDLRVSIVPCVTGEKIVMRILDEGSPLLGLDKLGFYPDQLGKVNELLQEQMDKVNELLQSPNGVIVVTGPVGSGKTTTLYSMLMLINTPDKSIVTVEDPVEHLIKGIEQAQVNVKAGFTFPAALRAFMRQDPDVVMAGEIRDLQSLELITQIAATGHLVLTTMHVPDAVMVPQRMMEVGHHEPSLIGRTLIGVIAQRLVRKVCQECKEEYTPSADALEFLGLQNKVGKVKFYRGKGCDACRGTGHKGRTAIYEVLKIDREMSNEIVYGKPDQIADRLLKMAITKGFVPMAEDARRKVLDGITTAEEAHRILDR